MHSSWFEIDLGQFRKNLTAIKTRVGSSRVCCVVKANAYGHGLIPIAQEAVRGGVDYLAVYHAHEGLSLRKAGIDLPILVLGAFQENQLENLILSQLEFVISSPFKARIAAEKALQLGVRCSVHVEIDTGMRRTGVRIENARPLIDLVESNPSFDLKGVFSHFVSSEKENDPETLRQIEQFRALKDSVGGGFLWHLANSGGVLYYPDSYLDLVRPGLLCYGVFPQHSIGEILPILSLKAKVSYFKVVAAGEGISYNHVHRTAQQTRIITIPVGYGDGYRRDFSNKMSILLRGKRHRIVGAVCMDQFMVDIGGSEAYVGDEVTLIGRQGEEVLSLVEMAELVHTDPREILAHFNDRIPRIYSDRLDSVVTRISPIGRSESSRD